MFSGLMSRCTMPAWCAAPSARVTCTAISSALDEGQRPSRDAVAQCFAVDELGRDEPAAGDLADLVDGENVGVVEGRGRAGLVGEAAQPAGVARERRRQQLERDLAIELALLREVDLAHAADAQQ